MCANGPLRCRNGCGGASTAGRIGYGTDAFRSGRPGRALSPEPTTAGRKERIVHAPTRQETAPDSSRRGWCRRLGAGPHGHRRREPPLAPTSVTMAMPPGTYYFFDLADVFNGVTPRIHTIQAVGRPHWSGLPRFSQVIVATMINGAPRFVAPTDERANGTYLVVNDS